VEPEYVAGEVVKQVMSGRSGQLVLPPSLTTLSTIRAWPFWLQTRARNHVAHTLEGSAEEYYKSLPAGSKS
jgi:all-trans-retinol dehydrogenase (NAD+)